MPVLQHPREWLDMKYIAGESSYKYKAVTNTGCLTFKKGVDSMILQSDREAYYLPCL